MKDCGIAMPVLDKITIQIGEEWGQLLVSHNFDNLKVCRCVPSWFVLSIYMYIFTYVLLKC